jgi:DNA sulfur modification protein DndB
MLALPALRGHMGDWVYYSALMPMSEIAARVSMAQEIHRSQRLGDWIQRQVDLSIHSASIKDYLLIQEQRFFNSIVLGVYGGSPKWAELSIDFGKRKLPVKEGQEGSLGLLALDGDEQLFAIDGQHRVAGIKQALEEDEKLGSEEVCVLFIAHSGDEAGRQRTRRLFSTLNRYAKPVSKMEIIALDEDDLVAIVTRRLVDEYPILHEFISLKKGNSIPKSDKESLSTVTALYDGLDTFLRPKGTSVPAWKNRKKNRPSEDEIAAYYSSAVEVWDKLTEAFEPLGILSGSTREDHVARRFRNDEGGHLIFRPIGLTMILSTSRLLLDEDVSLAVIMDRLHRAPMNLNEGPWTGLIWDPVNRIMITDTERQNVARSVLLYGLGGDLVRIKQNVEKVRENLAGMLNRTVADTAIVRWI